MGKYSVTQILAGVAVVAGLLVAFNAFIGARTGDKTASSRISSYLNLSRTQQETAEVSDAPNNVVVTPSGEQPSEVQSQQNTDSTDSQPADTSEQTEPTAVTAEGDKPASVYTVKEGDTYACIAEKYYGSYEHYKEVMASNPVNQTGFGEYQLHVGAQITLPAILASNLKPASSRCQ